MNVADEFLRIVRTLEAGSFEYAVVGGFAVGLHGVPRLTIDVDLLILESDLNRARQLLAPIGFDLESGWVTFRRGQPNEDRLFRLTKTDGSEFLTLDLMIVTPAMQSAWNRRERLQIGDCPVTVISRDDLIEMKRRAGRAQDIADVETLTAVHRGTNDAN